VVRQLLRDRKVVLLDHPGDERPPKIVGHDLHADLRATLAGNVIDRMFGDALARDVAASTNAVEQERVIHLPLLELRAAQFEPGVEFGKGPGGRIFDQLLVALARHSQAALGKIQLTEVQVDRLRLAHPRAIQNCNDSGVAQPLWPGVGGTHRHQFLDQRTAQVAPLGQPRAGDALDRAHLQQVFLADQAHAPGFIHYPAHGVDVQR